MKALLRGLPLVGEPLARAYRAFSPPRDADLAAIERRLRRGRRTQLVGPWTGGAETELLYWIPFLRLLVERGALDPERVRAVAEPRKQVLYEGIARACSEGSEGEPWLVDEVERLVRPYREGSAGSAAPLRLGVFAPLPRSAAGDVPFVAGTWSEATAVALFARVPTVVLEPDDAVLRRDVALAERVAQRLGAPFSVLQPRVAATLEPLLREAG